MEQQGLKELLKKGFAAMKAGSNVAAQATDEILDDAKNEGLRNALQQGNEQSKVWAQRIDRCLQEAEGQEDEDNEILKAHYEVSKQIRQQAPDDDSRDLGIIASGQMSLHYWIAAFGTQVSYAEACGMTNAQQEMQACLDEAKQADLNLTDVARAIIDGK
jgi:ferritin-like metal-binding protein YciE